MKRWLSPWVAAFLLLSLALVLPVNARAAAANDTFVAAQELHGAPGTVSGTNKGSSKEIGEPAHADNAGGASVWYRWTATASTRVVFDTVGTFDTLLAVYTGSHVAALTEIASNDDYGMTLGSRVNFKPVTGTEYLIAVDGYNGASGPFTLGWRLSPVNDDFADAQSIDGTAGSLTLSLEWATAEPGEPDHAGRPASASAWYRWIAPASGRFTFKLPGDETALAVYTGTSIDALNEVSSAPNAAGFTAVAGTEYRVAVNGSGSPTALRLSWHSAPPNDDFADAELIEGASGETVVVSPAWATAEPGEPDHGETAAAASVWYRWTPPTSGRFVFFGDGRVSTIAVYTGTTLQSLTEVSSDRYAVWFRADAGTDYRIAVNVLDSFEGDMDFSWLAGPPNDDFVDAQTIVGPSGTAHGSTWLSTTEPDEPGYGWGSIWYRWTAPATGRVRFDTRGSNFDTILSVYRGDSLGELVTVAESDDFYGVNSALSFPATANVTYSIAITGFDDYTGDSVLHWFPGAIIYGTSGANTLTGTAGRDLILGFGGNDVLSGLAGNDEIIGGGGADRLFGGSGNDLLNSRDGVRGNDRNYGGPGTRDTVTRDRGDLIQGIP